MPRRPFPVRHLIALGAVALVCAALDTPRSDAAEVKIFEIDTQASFLAGTLDGISVDPLGRLRLADRVQRVASIDEPFLLSAAPLDDGWVVGTGNAGRVLAVGRDGTVRELFAAPEPEIFAVWTDPDGTVYAGSSPRGKVYRIPAAAATGGTPPSAEEAELFDPGETYIWALARDAEGRLLVATGTEGRLYRVGADGTGTAVYDGDDTHLRALLPLPGGEVLLGTAGEGLVQLLTAAGDRLTARTLYDAPEPEVVALAAGPDGRLWAAVVASEASLVQVGSSDSDDEEDSDDEDDGEDESEGGGSVVIVDGGGSGAGISVGSRPRGFTGARSRLVSIERPSRVESRWSFDRETLFALSWQRGRLWVATGLEGKLYSWNGQHMVLEKDVDEGQIMALMGGESGPVFATTNAAALYRVSGGIERRGLYTSAPLDAGQAARFGTFRWRGDIPAGAGLELSFRSGVSARPDRTWSQWSDWQRAASSRGGEGGRPGRHGGEASLRDVDPGRYVQWRARFSSSGDASPRLFAVELSYRQQNLRPRIERFAVLDPGEILVPANFNPSNQVYEPASPNRDGIFTTLEPTSKNGSSRLKTLWKKGFRSLRWQVEDDNDDELTYRLTFQPETTAGTASSNGAGWLPMVADHDDEHFSFDSTALPDGLYRFRLEASDAGANEEGEALVAERVSEPVVIDNTPPRSLAVERRSGGLRITVVDDWNPLREVEVSIDGGGWEPLRPIDGLLDGRRESLDVEVPEGAHLVLVRVEDAAFNVATFDLSSELR